MGDIALVEELSKQQNAPAVDRDRHHPTVRVDRVDGRSGPVADAEPTVDLETGDLVIGLVRAVIET